MTANHSLRRRLATGLTAAALCLSPLAASADEPTPAELPTPKVSITLSADLINDVFGVTNAALTGVAEAMNAHQGGNEAVRLTAEQIAAAKRVIGLATDSVNGVRLRVYEGLDPAVTNGLLATHNATLADEGWEQVVEVNDKKERVRIALRNSEGAVRGVRVLVLTGSETVTIDADCDLSPERVQELTRTATQIGFELGLEEALEEVVKEIQQELGN